MNSQTLFDDLTSVFQKPAAGDDLPQDSHVQVEQQSGPAEGAAELQKPTKPVGKKTCHITSCYYNKVLFTI